MVRSHFRTRTPALCTRKSRGVRAAGPRRCETLSLLSPFGVPQRPSRGLEDSSCSSTQGKFDREQFYKFVIFPGKWIKVWCDRLALLALFDR